MVMSSFVLWGALIVVFLIMEASTVALVSLWFALGSVAALITAAAGAALWLQVTVFLIISCGLLALLRPALRKHVKITRTNTDAVIGSLGYVTADIDNVAAKGEVKFGSMTWTARSTPGIQIPVGTMVRADRIEGVKIFVSPACTEETPEQTEQ